MKNSPSIWCSPMVIGASVLAVLFAVSMYVVGLFYFNDEYEITPEKSVTAPTRDVTSLSFEAEGNSTSVPQTETDAASAKASDIADSETIEAVLHSESDVVSDTSNTHVESVSSKRVSPFGFGPYPEIPLDYPYQDLWEDIEQLYIEGQYDMGKNLELIDRVCIKLWNQGERVHGGVIEDGLVYPLYPNTIYVTWSEVIWEDGTIERILTNVTGPGDMAQYDADFAKGIIPPGITAIPHSEGGIDAYEFLNLDR